MLNPTKYASTNLASLSHTGSLEFRFAGCTRSTDRMLEFINIGLATRAVSCQFENGNELLNSVFTSPSLPEWIMEHYDERVNRTLAQAAENCGITPAAAHAAVLLCTAVAPSRMTIR